MKFQFHFLLFLAASVALIVEAAPKDYDNPFILREHLTTKSPYFPLGSFGDYTQPPQGCKAVYLNFVARSVASIEILSFQILLTPVIERNNIFVIQTNEIHQLFSSISLQTRKRFEIRSHFQVSLCAFFECRHGARVASKGEIVSFDKLASFIKANAAQLKNTAQFGWMLGWTNPFKVEDAQQLLPIGERQHFEIATRMAREYPEIFDIPADINFPRAFTIRTSEVARAAQSGISFAYGLFEYVHPHSTCRKN